MQKKELIMNGEVQLSGTVSMPKENLNGTAIIFIPGSGKIDRDGNVLKPKVNFNIYKDLSDYLVELGFITFRYDKRGVGKSEGSHLATGLYDSIQDVKAIIEHLRNDPAFGLKNILLLGHSEGTMIGTAVAASTEVDGLILLAGGGETLEEATKRQRELSFQALEEKKNITGWLFRTFSLAEKAEKKNQRLFKKMRDSNKDIIKVQMMPLPAKWLREHFDYDLLGDLKKLTCPVLAVTGNVDIQTDAEKLDRIRELVADAQCYELESMDHMLKEETEEPNILDAKNAYKKNVHKPLHPQLKTILENWLLRYNESN